MSITAGNDCDSINVVRDGIFKLLMSPGFDSKESIPPAYVAWRADTTILFLLDSKPSIDCSKIPAQVISLELGRGGEGREGVSRDIKRRSSRDFITTESVGLRDLTKHIQKNHWASG
jgi:hypothetical protein